MSDSVHTLSVHCSFLTNEQIDRSDRSLHLAETSRRVSRVSSIELPLGRRALCTVVSKLVCWDLTTGKRGKFDFTRAAGQSHASSHIISQLTEPPVSFPKALLILWNSPSVKFYSFLLLKSFSGCAPLSRISKSRDPRDRKLSPRLHLGLSPAHLIRYQRIHQPGTPLAWVYFFLSLFLILFCWTSSLSLPCSSLISLLTAEAVSFLRGRSISPLESRISIQPPWPFASLPRFLARGLPTRFLNDLLH